MRNFIFKLFLFILCFLVFDKVFLILTNELAENEDDKRLESLINGEINKDIIIAGSSRGSRGIIASRIEERISFSVFNLCYPGSDVEFHEFIVRALVKFNTPPKILLLVVDDNLEFLLNNKISFRKDRLYPLVKYPYIRKELSKRENKSKFILDICVLSRLNKASYNFRTVGVSLLDSIMSCGSMPISQKWQERNLEYYSEDRKYSLNGEISVKCSAFVNIINLCEMNSIKVVVVFPPNFQTHSKSFEERIRNMCDEKVYFYIYNQKNPIYKNQDYFYDEDHLMKSAAIVFTDEIIDYLNDFSRSRDLKN